MKAVVFVVQFGENLLMAAIRSGQSEMADFLIDNGVNFNHQKKVIVSISFIIDVHTLKIETMDFFSQTRI